MSEKILFFSDLHIHNHGNDWRRVDDALSVLDWILETCKEREITKAWFLGDWFHVRGYMYPSIVARAYNKLVEFKESNIEVIMLVGNHDMPYKQTTKHNCITAFGSVANVVEDVATYETDDWDFHLLPYVESTEHLNWAINRLARDKNKVKKNCLLAHMDIKGAKFHSNVESTHGIQSRDVSKSFDLVLTGHYHTHQQVEDNVWYIGSPYQQNFGEAGNKVGCMIFDNGRLEFIENTFSPKYLYLTPNEVDEKINDQYVTITAEDSTNVVAIRERASNFNPRKVTVRVDRTQMEDNRQLVTMKTDAKDVTALLKEWVNKTANKSIYDTEQLLSYGMSMVQESSES